ncbi:MAG TPA: glycosyltransferase [Candidatus Bipolaricaulota bacterium]|nr:glycosyltransferase [Candidatus Bipolaricaulota bacterium]
MKKIMHLITGLEPHGGAEQMLLKTLPGLKKTENMVCCLKGRGDIGRQLEQKGVSVRYLEAQSKFDLCAIWRYRKVIKDFKPDVQVNYLIHADIFSRIFGKLFGVKKIIAFIRNKHLDLPFLMKLDRLTKNKVNFFLFNSNAVRNFYHEKMGVPENKTKVIPNGVNLEKFQTSANVSEKCRELGLDENDFVIINVARLYPSKRQIDILRAIKKLNDPKIKYLQISVGEEENALKNFVEANGLSEQVKFLGYRSDVVELLKCSDLYISAAAHEGMSNSLLEAMAAGVPCVVSDIEENKELIENKATGLTFKVKDAADLAEKMNWAIRNGESMRSFSDHAKKMVECKYDIKKVIEMLDEFLFEF